MGRDWMTAAEALKTLGTRPQTLYANVSRGRIRARKDPLDPRKSLYAAADVDGLAARRRGRRSSASVASEAIQWGEPVLPSAISTISGGRLYYRGQDAVLMSKNAGFEEVVGLLLGGGPVELGATSTAAVPTGTAPAGGVMVRLAARAATDLPTPGRTVVALRAEAAAVLAEVCGEIAGGGTGPVHERLARRWNGPRAADCLRRALVLMADHELNASTFATRVAASTGASLAAAVLAGYCTLSGPRHGGAGAQLVALIEMAEQKGAARAVRAWLERGQGLPGMSHVLYPDGDVRATALMSAFDMPPQISELKREAEAASGHHVNIDFALAALTAAFHLPHDAPMHIFGLARMAGWLAHALEQVETGTLIRPRARYTGPAVTGSET